MLHYQNPLWPGYFADPFVLRTPHGYYAYGTGPAVSEREFPVLWSADLSRWETRGGALTPLDKPATYWAPEVAECNGRYYLYYSASTAPSDDGHRLRVAIADEPGGPFEDTGKLLLPDVGFSIDASPFHDPQTGRWFLFFASDFEADAPFGTGLSAVELQPDMTSVVGPVHRVLRASASWQVYERNRKYKGKDWPEWNCVEGPSPVFHDGRYYLFYSGGAWNSENYGVGFAQADHPFGPWRDDAAVHGPAVLKGIPGSIVGPGHNSTVIGPDGETRFMIYHAWDPKHTARRMCMDPVRWTEHGPLVEPSIDRPMPL